jgi:hypothetical protein
MIAGDATVTLPRIAEYGSTFAIAAASCVDSLGSSSQNARSRMTIGPPSPCTLT